MFRKTSLIIKMFTNIFDHKNVFESIYPAFERIEILEFFFLLFFLVRVGCTGSPRFSY